MAEPRDEKAPPPTASDVSGYRDVRGGATLFCMQKLQEQEEQLLRLPDRKLALCLFELRLASGLTSAERAAELRKDVLQAVEANRKLVILKELNRGMVKIYRAVCGEFKWPLDETLAQKMEIENEREDEELQAAISAAEQSEGDLEVKNALLRRANAFCRHGDFERARACYGEARGKSVGSGSKLDALMVMARVGILFERSEYAESYLEQARVASEKGGDWERRNRVKVYSALSAARRRDFAAAVPALIACAPVFTATEIVDFPDFIFVAVVLALVTLDRAALKREVINNAEINVVLDEDPVLKELLMSFHEAKYRRFFRVLLPVCERIQRNFWLWPHMKYLLRLMRARAYAQYVAPYSSVTVPAMSSAFGVSSDFLVEDVADLIANGKLPCKLDTVDHTLEKAPFDAQADLQRKTLETGDALLAKLQRLSKIIDI